MKLSWKHYLIFLCVFIGSIILSIFIPLAEFIRQFAAIPAIIALLGALFQLIRDEARYQKELLLQRDQQLFDIGATSHMANVAFDKHVQFCEEYIFEMYEAITTLHREGPTQLALNHADKLFLIQNKHRLWLTPAIESGLKPFEQALRIIGANEHFYKSDPAKAVDSGKVNESDSIFRDMLSIAKSNNEPVNQQIAISTILKHLRNVLGVEDLTNIRQKLILIVNKEKHF